MSTFNKDLKLLPKPFKIVSYILMGISLSIVIITKSKSIGIEDGVIKDIAKVGIMISMLILALTKNRVEDELILRIRVKAFAMSYIFGVSMVIVFSIISLLLKGETLEYKGFIDLIISMLIFYFIIFNSLKRGMK